MAVTVSDPIAVMKRYELKYLLSPEQTDFLRRRLEGHMEADRFGLTTIASLYFDTPENLLVRRSIEKPEYKEKIRLRSYGRATESSPVYLELKRKADGIVYKRRVQSTLPRVREFFAGDDTLGGGQIGRELAAFREMYRDLRPACLILYDRVAYFEPEGSLRLTIDAAPRYRTDRLTLTDTMDGLPLLPLGWTILELKVQDAMPLWMAEILSEGKIYKSSFSKYGEAYRLEHSAAPAPLRKAA